MKHLSKKNRIFLVLLALSVAAVVALSTARFGSARAAAPAQPAPLYVTASGVAVYDAARLRGAPGVREIRLGGQMTSLASPSQGGTQYASAGLPVIFTFYFDNFFTGTTQFLCGQAYGIAWTTPATGVVDFNASLSIDGNQLTSWTASGVGIASGLADGCYRMGIGSAWRIRMDGGADWPLDGITKNFPTLSYRWTESDDPTSQGILS